MITMEDAYDHHDDTYCVPMGTIVTMVGEDPKRKEGAVWYTVQCEDENGHTYALRYRDITEAPESLASPEERIEEVVALIQNNAMCDGEHHKIWLFNEVLRKLMGGEEFVKWVGEYNEDESYADWDLGVA